MRKSQSGFTLIELVVVIAILAILTAVALPRFAALQAQARIAKMNGALGAMKSAAVMSHALLLANQYATNYTGDPAAPDINVEGVNAIYVQGYPSSSTILPLAGVGGTAATGAGSAAVGDYYVVSNAAGVLTLAPDASHVGGTTNCTFTYTEAAGVNTQPTYVTTNLTVDNCS
ncbi:MAG: type II secretion system protein [Oxalobacter sp.]|nr:MAG: type II secretion system protein [Oxalobacter sp.]